MSDGGVRPGALACNADTAHQPALWKLAIQTPRYYYFDSCSGISSVRKTLILLIKQAVPAIVRQNRKFLRVLRVFVPSALEFRSRRQTYNLRFPLSELIVRAWQ